MRKSKPDLGNPEALRLVVAGTAAETGRAFFRALVGNLGTSLGTLGAWVTEYFPEEQRLLSLGMWLNGKSVERYEYALAGTACQQVVENREIIHIPDRLIELFPRDDDLVPLNAVSYLGAPLLDTGGRVMGHLGSITSQCRGTSAPSRCLRSSPRARRRSFGA